MRKRFTSVLMLMAITVAALLPACADETQTMPTVEGTYLGLSTGALREARLNMLPKGTVLHAGALTITEQQVTAEITKAKPNMHSTLTAQRFFILEQMATKTLLLAEARTWAQTTKWTGKPDDERALSHAYLTNVAQAVTVTDQELCEYYEANKDMMGGAAYEAVVDELRAYVLDEKCQQAVDRHIQTISTRTVVEVDATWMAAQAKTMLDNPVDNARRSGKPSVIDFGRGGCRPCDMMTPILEELRNTYADQCNVLFCHVGDEPIIAARYNVRSIPVQVFFDMDGKEVFRHVGFFPKAQMLAKLAELGVKP